MDFVPCFGLRCIDAWYFQENKTKTAQRTLKHKLQHRKLCFLVHKMSKCFHSFTVHVVFLVRTAQEIVLFKFLNSFVCLIP